MKDFAAIDDLLKPCAAFARLLHGFQQFEELRLVAGAGIFAQRLPERQMAQGAMRRERGRIGRHEGEGIVRVLAVLRQVEMHASHETPSAVAVFEKLLERKPAFHEFGDEGVLHAAPQRLQHTGLQIFGTLHRRRLVDQGGEIVKRQRRDMRRLSGLLRIIARAQRSHKSHGECAPKGERGREMAPRLAGAKLQETMTAIACEMLFEPIGDRFIERKFVVGPLQAQNAMWR